MHVELRGTQAGVDSACGCKSNERFPQYASNLSWETRLGWKMDSVLVKTKTSLEIRKVTQDSLNAS